MLGGMNRDLAFIMLRENVCAAAKLQQWRMLHTAKCKWPSNGCALRQLPALLTANAAVGGAGQGSDALHANPGIRLAALGCSDALGSTELAIVGAGCKGQGRHPQFGTQVHSAGPRVAAVAADQLHAATSRDTPLQCDPPCTCRCGLAVATACRATAAPTPRLTALAAVARARSSGGTLHAQGRAGLATLAGCHARGSTQQRQPVWAGCEGNLHRTSIGKYVHALDDRCSGDSVLTAARHGSATQRIWRVPPSTAGCHADRLSWHFAPS